MKVLLDTNFLLIPGTLGVDVFSQIEKVMDEQYMLCVVSGTLAELHSIVEKQKGKHRQAAQLALKLIESHDVTILDCSDDSNRLVDDVLVDLSIKERITVCTQDRELKQRLEENGARILTLRQKKYVVRV